MLMRDETKLNDTGEDDVLPHVVTVKPGGVWTSYLNRPSLDT
jgi:hypothetical protein